jgi:phenylalanine-4-hydroxylase
MDDALKIDPDFTPEQHKTWAELYKRQLPKVEKWAADEYLEGFPLLDLPSEGVPSLEYLTSKIEPVTGWTIIRTHTRYSDADEWYGQMIKKHFIVTDYMRSWDELDWTPEPDMFHDIFGHLPFFMLPRYAGLFEIFAPAFLNARTDEQRESVKRLAWFSTEFGIKFENGEKKIFGTGLMSGGDEMATVMADDFPLIPFTVENVISKHKVMYEHHDQLFSFESIDEIRQDMADYFDTF